MVKEGDIVYFVGIKGTGMTALAELFKSFGAIVKGSDVADQFYTDEILAKLAITVYENFDKDNVLETVKYLVYSAAYNPDEHPEILKAKSLGIQIFSYPQALGALSKKYISAGVSGVHGKTTTTAIAGTLIKELDLPCSVLTGSAAANFGGRSTFINGEKYFIAETCEYKRNFLNFSPMYLIITSIEPDHLDYYKDYDDILNAFIEYGRNLAQNGSIIFCSDDKGACEAVEQIRKHRPDIEFIPYGINAEGDFKITLLKNEPGRQNFSLNKYDSFIFTIKIAGLHNIRNSAAAIALISKIAEVENAKDELAKKISEGLVRFRGTKRRCEIVGEVGDILFLDDYGHHPSAIQTTIKGLKDFYPNRRIIVDFMSHTYSRTEALIDGFANSFSNADIVFLHKIYASAREKERKISGIDLFNKLKQNHNNVFYYEEIIDAYEPIRSLLKPGDVFVTMGAGDNWTIGYKIYRDIKKTEDCDK